MDSPGNLAPGFRRVLIAVALLTCSSHTLAQSDEELIGLVLELAQGPGAEQRKEFGRQFTGLWINLEGQYPEYLAASSGDSALYRGRIGAYEVAQFRGPLDSAALAERLASVLEEESPATDDPLRQAIDGALRERARAIMEVAVAAAERGDSSVAYAGINFELPRTQTSAEDTLGARFLITDSYLYRRDGNSYIPYVRDTALTPEQSERWFGTNGVHAPNGNYRRVLESAYAAVERQCYLHLLEDHPVDECRAMRDRAADFGVELRPERQHPRDMTIPIPTDAEVAFWKTPASRDAERVPYLSRPSYCYVGPHSGSAYESFLAQIAARGLRDTQWAFNAGASFPPKKPGNWSEEEYGRLQRSIGGMDQSMTVFGPVTLRADGVIGLNFFFDLRNRWRVDGDSLLLNFHDGAVWFRFDLNDGLPRNGESNLATFQYVQLQFKHGDYELYNQIEEGLGSHPDAAEIDALMRSRTCPSGVFVAEVAPREAPLSEAEKLAAPIPGLPADFPRVWEVRAEPVNSGTPAVDRVAYYHLGAPDRLGLRENENEPFNYSYNLKWQLDGDTLVWEWPNDRYVFELTADGARATGRTNKDYWMVIRPVSGSAQGVEAATPAPQPPPPTTTAARAEPATAPAPAQQVSSAAPATATPEPASVPEAREAPLPEWEIIGFWDYDGADGQFVPGGLALVDAPGWMGGIQWSRQLRLNQHDSLPKRNRTLWPVQINREQKKVCIDAPYPSFSAQVSFSDSQHDGVYAFASCKGGS